MKLLILLHHRFEFWDAPPWFAERLRHDYPGLEVAHLSSYEGAEAYLRDAEVLVSWSLRPEQFRSAAKLRWIHSPSAAVHQLMFPELIDSDVMITNGREVHGPVVAEHVIALILALAKRLPQAFELQRQGIWGQELMWQARPRPREIAEATLGLVGLGNIGREVATRAAALHMRVIAVREHPQKQTPEGVLEVYGPPQLDQLLGQSDYVVLSVPVTPATRSLIDEDRISAMKSDAYLINVGRGTLVEEAALAQALRNQKIAGAALDVFEQEPLMADSPLWAIENLLITPHTAGLTEKAWQRQYAVLSENLSRYLAHQPLLASVDKSKGY